MIGHVVVCHGSDSESHESVAVWHVDTNGIGTGAWVMPITMSDPDLSIARKLLQLVRQRAIVGWDPTRAVAILTALGEAASLTTPDWSRSTVALPDALGEIGLTRSAYEKRTIDEQLVKSNIVSIEWPVELPEQVPATEDDFWQECHLVLPQASPVAQAALRTTMLVSWSVQRWRETMTALGRRDYLKTTFGRQRRLPPRWETRLADAYVQVPPHPYSGATVQR
ncbi:MAG: hypothetical protein GEV28_23980 [Actinophytocola sp.]|uniref:DUF6218 family protein n=1 Tax=Actinophytocola sp. TaxID=1872138 RepID=UPI0013248F3A|nr:DUF6218 family protein [Actinophytocola sp.]MPZ83284.1 hypothetical protein [Actinophytocola sp.]